MNGWYNRPVEFAIAGDDATAGILACPDVTYAGPDGAAASLTGRCTDRAGNQASRAFGLKFDATAPALMDLAATPADPSVAEPRTTPDTESVGVTRTPGVGQERASVVFGGPGTGFVDGRVDNGVQYAVRGARAGSRRQRPQRDRQRRAVRTARPARGGRWGRCGGNGDDNPSRVGPHRACPHRPPHRARRRRRHQGRPAAAAALDAGARRELLQRPALPRRQDPDRVDQAAAAPASSRRWRHGGRRYRLTPGEYHWIVWPGFGLRSKADYCWRIGRRGFEVAPAGR